MCHMDGQPQLLRLPDVLRLVGVSRSTLYKMISMHDFPAPVRIGRRAVAWPACEVFAWIESRPRAGATQRRRGRIRNL